MSNEINASVLGNWLGSIRKTNKESPKDICNRINLSWLSSPNQITRFERGKINKLIELNKAIEIANAYQAYEIFVYHLASPPTRDTYIYENIYRLKNAGTNGSETSVWVPPNSLNDLSSSISRVDYNEEAYSNFHNHFGDELTYVLDGQLQLEFGNGVNINLNKNDFAVFDATQFHRGVNPSKDKKAKVLIIRNKFLFELGTRDQLREKISQTLKNRDSTPSKTELADLIKAFSCTLAKKNFKPSNKNAKSESISDTYSLGRFLERRIKEQSLSIGTIAKKAELYDISENKTYFSRLHHGQVEVKLRELPIIAEIYNTNPLILYNFSSSVEANAIVTRNLENVAETNIFSASGEEVSHTKFKYRIPPINLELSDIQVAHATISAGSIFKQNSHNQQNGSEILFLLSGSILIDFPKLKKSEMLKPNDFIHFSGFHSHVIKAGTEEAQVLIITLIG